MPTLGPEHSTPQIAARAGHAWRCSAWLMLAIVYCLWGSPAIGQIAFAPEPSAATRRIPGSLVLAGSGRVDARTMGQFRHLAYEEGCEVLVLHGPPDGDRNDPSALARMEGPTQPLRISRQLRDGSELERVCDALLSADAVWIDESVGRLDEYDGAVGARLLDALRRSAARDKVIGGGGVGAGWLSEWAYGAKTEVRGAALLPNAIIATAVTASAKARDAPALPNTLVHIDLPKQGVLVVSEGRRLSVLGSKDVTLLVASSGDLPRRKEVLSPEYERLPYNADFIGWSRAGLARECERFPADKAPEPVVRSGALMMIGGGGSTDAMWTRVRDHVGGVGAKVVLLSQYPSSFHKRLAGLGFKDIAVFESSDFDGNYSGEDDAIAQAISEAEIVLLGGGRTFRFMDEYQNTPVHEELTRLLERGGVVAGTSAGAQIQGDFLVRGDPRTNKTLHYPGNDTGFGLLRGVIIDAHFRERGRHNTLPALLQQFPAYLGIGLDEATALWIEGSQAEVIGRASVTFYDTRSMASEEDDPAAATGAESKPGTAVSILTEGEVYDLVERKRRS